MSDPTAREAYRRADEALDAIRKHEKECSERWKEAAAELRKMRDYQLEDAARRQERQSATDRRQRFAQWGYWITGIAVAALAAKDYVVTP